MGNFSYILSVEGETEFQVSKNHFGGNVIGDDKNDVPSVDDLTSGVGSDSYFQDAVAELGVSHLRYPAGKAEEANITKLVGGELNSELAGFIDYCVVQGLQFTLVIPVREEYIADQAGMTAFTSLVYDRLGESTDLLQSIELGNEHWEAVGEAEYGEQAFTATGFLIEALDVYNSSHLGTVDPNIIVQTGNPSGRASDFNAGNYVGDVPGYDERIRLANEAIVEQFDKDKDLSNGFQSTIESDALDGIVAHYYYSQTSNTFSDTLSEERRISLRDDPWIGAIGEELSYHITEWNVMAANYGQQGLIAASVILEQFENMLQAGVDFAEIWPIRENTTNAIAGGHDPSEYVSLTPAGRVFSWMSESLITPEGGLSLLELGGTLDRDVEINGYQDSYRTVIYVSSRTNDFGSNVFVDWSDLVDSSSVYSVSGKQLGIDLSTSDGFSQQRGYDDNGDLVGGTGLARRAIDTAEAAALRQVLGDAYREYYVVTVGGELRTYLPPADSILPMVDNPTSLSDFYFAAETDIAGLETILEISDTATSTSLTLDPYEVVEITIENTVTIDGTSVRDVLQGGYGRDIIYGGAGADSLFGHGGDDILYGGEGADILYGGAGSDTASYATSEVHVTVNLDDVSQNTGDASGDLYSSIENITGSESDDFLTGNNSANVILGGGGGDHIEGGHGNDTLDAGQGADFVVSGIGDDVVWGGEGNDVLFGSAGDDIVSGGEGSDLIYGGTNDDILLGDEGDDIIFGDIGNDYISGGTGSDIVIAGAGDDEIYGGSGTDVIDGGSGDDRLNGGLGDDRLNGGSGADVFIFDAVADFGNDIILDFVQGTDMLEFSGVTYDELIFVTSEGNSRIEWNNGSVEINNVNTLTVDDFVFV